MDATGCARLKLLTIFDFDLGEEKNSGKGEKGRGGVETERGTIRSASRSFLARAVNMRAQVCVTYTCSIFSN